MEVVKKNISLKNITGNTITIPLCLKQSIQNSGLYNDISLLFDVVKSKVIISGTTDNKLDLVRGYDYNNPYTIGINGVSNLTDTEINYQIGNVYYITNLNSLFTTFSFTDNRDTYTGNNFISDDLILNYTDTVNVQDTVFIERQNTSVIENFSKIRQVGSVSEIETFSNSFYHINDQTI